MLNAAVSDAGIQKKINQDAVIVKETTTDGGDIMFAAVCDGMGGHTNGEVASAEAVSHLDSWFDRILPHILETGITNASFKRSMTGNIVEVNDKIVGFGKSRGECGTTLSGVLLYNGHYACVNVGDSRVYHLHKGSLRQITHDQSLVQHMVDNFEITEEEAKTHPKRNVLLQCIGIDGDVIPAYTFGSYEDDDVFVICSDGFRHKLEKKEIKELFLPEELTSESKMKEQALKGVQINKDRNETDNISVIVIKT